MNCESLTLTHYLLNFDTNTTQLLQNELYHTSVLQHREQILTRTIQKMARDTNKKQTQKNPLRNFRSTVHRQQSTTESRLSETGQTSSSRPSSNHCLFFFYGYAPHLYLPPYPTRPSPD